MKGLNRTYHLRHMPGTPTTMRETHLQVTHRLLPTASRLSHHLPVPRRTCQRRMSLIAMFAATLTTEGQNHSTALSVGRSVESENAQKWQQQSPSQPLWPPSRQQQLPPRSARRHHQRRRYNLTPVGRWSPVVNSRRRLQHRARQARAPRHRKIPVATIVAQHLAPRK